MLFQQYGQALYRTPEGENESEKKEAEANESEHIMDLQGTHRGPSDRDARNQIKRTLRLITKQVATFNQRSYKAGVPDPSRLSCPGSAGPAPKRLANGASFGEFSWPL